MVCEACLGIYPSVCFRWEFECAMQEAICYVCWATATIAADIVSDKIFGAAAPTAHKLLNGVHLFTATRITTAELLHGGVLLS